MYYKNLRRIFKFFKNKKWKISKYYVWYDFFKKGEICHNKRCVIITCAEKENFWKGL